MLIKLKPVFQEKIWGGSRMADLFGYELHSDKTGECWAICAHSGGQSVIDGGIYDGWTLGRLWQEHRELFGNLGGSFPLLVKIIDAREDLSIQVHPDDDYASANENGALGKTECWYVLDCKENATIIIGHNAQSKEEMAQMVGQNRWSELLREVPIRKGDFFQIEPGCLHAIKAGTVILETQQSSDVTYRFYDYGRLENGKPRALHIEKSLAVTKAPFVPYTATPQSRTLAGGSVTTLVRCPYYTVELVAVTKQVTRQWNSSFVNISIIEGNGFINDQPVRAGDHLLKLCDNVELIVQGTLIMICSYTETN